VNSAGTKLSKGDMALAKICADWPDARDHMKQALKDWTASGYHFTLDWLLRSVNTALTGEAKFSFLHDKSAEGRCFRGVGPPQMARPNSYRLMNSPITRSCICSVLEKHNVRRMSRLIRVRRLMCLLSIFCVFSLPT